MSKRWVLFGIVFSVLGTGAGRARRRSMRAGTARRARSGRQLTRHRGGAERRVRVAGDRGPAADARYWIRSDALPRCCPPVPLRRSRPRSPIWSSAPWTVAALTRSRSDLTAGSATDHGRLTSGHPLVRSTTPSRAPMASGSVAPDPDGRIVTCGGAGRPAADPSEGTATPPPCVRAAMQPRSNANATQSPHATFRADVARS
jgi:hypothetical protein